MQRFFAGDFWLSTLLTGVEIVTALFPMNLIPEKSSEVTKMSAQATCLVHETPKKLLQLSFISFPTVKNRASALLIPGIDTGSGRTK